MNEQSDKPSFGELRYAVDIQQTLPVGDLRILLAQDVLDAVERKAVRMAILLHARKAKRQSIHS